MHLPVFSSKNTWRKNYYTLEDQVLARKKYNQNNILLQQSFFYIRGNITTIIDKSGKKQKYKQSTTYRECSRDITECFMNKN